MQTQNLSKTALAFAAIVVASMMLVPSVVAQQTSATTTLNLDTPKVTYSEGTAIVPDTGFATVKIPWVYKIQTSGFENAGLVNTGTTLKFDNPSCDNGEFTVTGAQSYPVSVKDGTTVSNEDSGEATFIVTASQAAPGERNIRCTFTGEVLALSGSQVPATGKQSTSGPIVVRYLGLISANIPTTIKQAGPQKEIRYDIEVSNLGNAQSTILFELANSDTIPKGWQPVTPTEITLQSQAQGGTDTVKTVSFLVSTPFKNGWNNDQTTFQLRMTPASTKDIDTTGTPLTVNMLARVRGVYVPSLEPMVMLGAVLGSAMMVRLLRKDE